MIPIESSALAKLMSASIAPVFLITGISGILATMSLRYGRVIDRIRTLLRDGPKLYLHEQLGAEHFNQELLSLYKRARLMRMAIICEVLSIFSIAITIFGLFFSMSFGFEFPYAPQIFFSVALILMIIGLFPFIKDFAMSLRCIEHDMNVRSTVELPESKHGLRIK